MNYQSVELIPQPSCNDVRKLHYPLWHKEETDFEQSSQQTNKKIKWFIMKWRPINLKGLNKYCIIYPHFLPTVRHWKINVSEMCKEVGATTEVSDRIKKKKKKNLYFHFLILTKIKYFFSGRLNDVSCQLQTRKIKSWYRQINQDRCNFVGRVFMLQFLGHITALSPVSVPS